MRTFHGEAEYIPRPIMVITIPEVTSPMIRRATTTVGPQFLTVAVPEQRLRHLRPNIRAAQATIASRTIQPLIRPPASDQPQTILVFKDGHQVEVANYAIVGNTLYDLSSGHRQKIALADLDLTATAKQNDDRGIDFQVPAANEAN